LLAFALLTGARDNAMASLRLKHIDVREVKIIQDARDVRTKASKTITTYFFPVGDDFRTVVEEWVTFLRHERQWGLNDPLFPATRIIVGESNRFEAAGLDRRCWRKCDANKENLQGCIYGRRTSLLQPTLVPENSGEAWRAKLLHARRVQGVEPELRA
jgi:hypothetical protein